MGLIANTLMFVVFNVIIGSLLIMSNSGSVTYSDYDQLSDNSTSINAGDINDIKDVSVSSTSFINVDIPSWFYGLYLMFNSLWLSVIVVGWIRGVY